MLVVLCVRAIACGVPDCGLPVDFGYVLVAKRGSKRKASGWPMRARAKSRWTGFSRRVSSPGTRALGTRSTAGRPRRIQSSPMDRSCAGAGSDLQCQGQAEGSTVLISDGSKSTPISPYCSSGSDESRWTSIYRTASVPAAAGETPALRQGCDAIPDDNNFFSHALAHFHRGSNGIVVGLETTNDF